MTRNKSDKPADGNESDSELFRDAISGVRPLKKNDKITPVSMAHKNIPVNKHTIQEDFCYGLSDFAGELNTSTADEILAHRGNGIHQRLFKKLKNGQIPIEARLDLHGLNVDTARTVLSQFIADCTGSQYRCVIIVHGKGSRGGLPVLKSMLNHWLKQIPDILAFCSAQPQNGGTGAVYVLLKKTNATE
ncbi:MAG: Smr/MutS family endonuclease [Gammaproteobacteria bacterium]|nr:Smr/MutS family endonuclease [Gammaproteobacteria bacterium]